MEIPTATNTAEKAELSTVVVPLLKGVLYREQQPEVWHALFKLNAQVADYVRVLGLTLEVDESEGYAFLRSLPEAEADEEGRQKPPRLIARRPLSFRVSLLLALLRGKLTELDGRGGETRLILTRDDMVEMLRIFLPDSPSEARLTDQIEGHINKLVELGFVRPMQGQKKVYEIRRIVKAFVDAQWLKEFEERLDEYRRHAGGVGHESD